MSGVVSGIKDTFFGGAQKKEAKAQQKGFERQIETIREGQEQARGDVMSLFPQARESLSGGFQSALDVFGQALPQQAQVFQGGNVAAQQTLIDAFPQIQNALLGNQVNMSAFQPYRANYDLSFANQTLPTQQTQNDINQQATAVMPDPLIGVLQNKFNRGIY